MWGVVTPEEAQAKVEQQKLAAGIPEPKNLEEQAISLVGMDIYEKLGKGYTEKQWGRDCRELPAFIISWPIRAYRCFEVDALEAAGQMHGHWLSHPV